MWTVHIQVNFTDSEKKKPKTTMKIFNMYRCVHHISDQIYKDFYFDKYYT